MRGQKDATTRVCVCVWLEVKVVGSNDGSRSHHPAGAPLFSSLDTVSITESKDDFVASQLSVNVGHALSAVTEVRLITGIEEHSELLAAVLSYTGTLADDLRWVGKVLEDRAVDGSEGSRAGTGLLDTGTTAWLAEDSALANKDDVAVGELLLELTGQPG